MVSKQTNSIAASAAHRTIAPGVSVLERHGTETMPTFLVNIYLPIAGYNAPTSSKR